MIKIKSIIKNTLKRMVTILEKSAGIIIRRKILSEKLKKSLKLPHSEIFPYATYSPWKKDSQFQKLFKVAREYSLVDEYRMYELYKLASQASYCKGDFLEVGVWRGGTSAVIQKALIDKASENKFYVADTFKGVVKAGSNEDSFYMGGEHSDTNVRYVKDLFKKIKVREPIILVGIFPDNFVNLDIENLAFVHCDVDAYESTKDIIEWCLPKMLRGGIIVFDDYGFYGCDGVTKYVNDLMLDSEEISNQFRFLHNLNGHAVLIKV